MRNKKLTEISRPSSAGERDVQVRVNKENAGFTREDLRRDTYVPVTAAKGFPRAVRAANCHDV
jgi:hypothetical protein